MSYASEMLDSHAGSYDIDIVLIAATIDALSDCAQACTADIDADLSEQNLTEMAMCIRLCLDCADVCAAAARIISRPARHSEGVTKPLLQACAVACRNCGDECERHAQMHRHCRVCAEACRRCEQSCQDLLDAVK